MADRVMEMIPKPAGESSSLRESRDFTHSRINTSTRVGESNLVAELNPRLRRHQGRSGRRPSVSGILVAAKVEPGRLIGPNSLADPGRSGLIIDDKNAFFPP